MRSVRGEPCDIELTRAGSPIATSCSGSETGSERTMTASIKVKIAVLAPIPSASAATMTAVNPALRRSVRNA